ncbi:alpha/beta hydrolase [Streptomyces sp. b94]|uniref:alpha/beta fold hydrolase n=1 Tax=Streptomyces sp. b94 TaxID=1827634 RepID=UPI001B373614|nr:alpha/beta hydrolase [Streptomyces sp. b94]MBQ1097934.1 alpha/beta hydrolase [Streptomyces sp. b94]
MSGAAYTVHGTGRPVVLIAGAGGDGRIWAHHQVPALTAAGHQAITFDHDTANSPVHELTARLREVVSAIGSPPCPLVGHSLGALAVQELLLTDPRLASGAVLAATRGRSDAVGDALYRAEAALAETASAGYASGEYAPSGYASRGSASAGSPTGGYASYGFAPAGTGGRLPPEYESFVRLVQNLSPRTLADEGAVTEWLDLFEVAALSGTSATQRPGRPVPNRLAAYARITTPVLVVGFADDVLAPAYLGREVAAAVPGARYAELADAGHLGFLERPAAFNTLLLDFLSTLPTTCTTDADGAPRVR